MCKHICGLVALTALWLSAPCSAQTPTNTILQWNTNLEEGIDYEIHQGAREIVIHQCEEGLTFWFEAVIKDGLAILGPGDIDLIEVDPNAGSVSIKIVTSYAPRVYGARNVGEISLINTGVDSVIEEMTLSGDLATIGPAVANEFGTCAIDGDVVYPVTMDVLAGDFVSGSLGDFTVSGGPTQELSLITPSIHVGATYDSVMDVNATLAELTIDGDVSGDVTIANLWSGDITGEVSGALTITGNLGDGWEVGLGIMEGVSGSLYVEAVDGLLSIYRGGVEGLLEIGDITESALVQTVASSVSGTLHVMGDWDGTVSLSSVEERADMTGDIVVDGVLGGDLYLNADVSGTVVVNGEVANDDVVIAIYVSGALQDLSGVGDGGHFIFNGPVDAAGDVIRFQTDYPTEWATEYVAFDYDGWNAGDQWTGGCVFAYQPWESYCENTPAAHVWAITECRGDMNNDGVVDAGDVNPFVYGLLYPSTYNVMWSGLSGARVFHGDCNCDTVFTVADINFFSDRVVSECCDSACPGCEGQDGLGGGATPAEMAELLGQNVDAGAYDGLVNIVANAAAAYGDSPLGEYWTSVYGYLTD